MNVFKTSIYCFILIRADNLKERYRMVMALNVFIPATVACAVYDNCFIALLCQYLGEAEDIH